MISKGQKTKERICEIASRLFMEKGFKDVSMQDICNATGLSKGGLYRHYSNKGEILLAAVHKNITVEEDIQRNESAVVVLEAFLNVYRKDMLKRKQSLALALYEYASMGNEAVFTNGVEDKLRWRQLIQYGVSTGEFNDVEPEMVMDIMLYAYRGIQIWGRVIHIEETTVEHIIQAVKVLLLKTGE